MCTSYYFEILRKMLIIISFSKLLFFGVFILIRLKRKAIVLALRWNTRLNNSIQTLINLHDLNTWLWLNNWWYFTSTFV